MDHPGGSTVDLSPRPQPPTPPADQPDDKERRLRRFGTLSLISGVAIEVTLALASLVMAVVSDNNAYSNPTAELFGVLSHLAFVSLAGGLIAIGGMERLSRRHRAESSDNAKRLAEAKQQLVTVAELTRAVNHNRILLERLSLDGNERFDVTMGHLRALPARMSAMEDRQQALEDLLSARLEVLEKAVERVPQYPEAVLDGIDLARGMVAGNESDRE